MMINVVPFKVAAVSLLKTCPMTSFGIHVFKSAFHVGVAIPSELMMQKHGDLSVS
jgi:hypothetical protein